MPPPVQKLIESDSILQADYREIRSEPPAAEAADKSIRRRKWKMKI